MALMVVGITYGLRTCLRPWDEWTGESAIDSPTGKTALTALIVSAVIFISVYTIMAYPYIAREWGGYWWYESFFYDFYRYSTLIISIGYFLLAAGIPLAFRAGRSSSATPSPESAPPEYSSYSSAPAYSSHSSYASNESFSPYSSISSNSSGQYVPSASPPSPTPSGNRGVDQSLILPRPITAEGWVCPECGARIEGPGRSCTTCGYRRSRY